ncbi:uncharacterized protein LOC119267426 [Triticum dicoccoides]|uniref:uncharacterized protein LOC119267426 n=1 Tax=Triticum dicoccoides TaxID=85692 RepID=UPI00188E1477|nr:uncharacterized protein LOC119267426 [Triticum dicoccoides]
MVCSRAHASQRIRSTSLGSSSSVGSSLPVGAVDGRFLAQDSSADEARLRRQARQDIRRGKRHVDSSSVGRNVRPVLEELVDPCLLAVRAASDVEVLCRRILLLVGCLVPRVDRLLLFFLHLLLVVLMLFGIVGSEGFFEIITPAKKEFLLWNRHLLRKIYYFLKAFHVFALIMVVLSMFARRAMLHFGFWRAVRVMLLVVIAFQCILAAAREARCRCLHFPIGYLLLRI